MANRHPDALRARQAKRRRNQPGSLAALQAKLWRVIERAETILAEAESHETQLRAIHAFGQSCGQFVKIVEAGELATWVTVLEERLQVLGIGGGS